MGKSVHFTSESFEEFCRLAMLSEIEVKVLETRIRGFSITQQSQLLSISESTVNRLIRGIKTKYDRVQPMSDKLPPRRSSKQEEWMDTH